LQGQAGLVLIGGIFFVSSRELDRLALNALEGGGDEGSGFVQAVFGRFAGGFLPRTHRSGIVLEKGRDAVEFGAGIRVGAGDGREEGSKAGGGGVNGLVNLFPKDLAAMIGVAALGQEAQTGNVRTGGLEGTDDFVQRGDGRRGAKFVVRAGPADGFAGAIHGIHQSHAGAGVNHENERPGLGIAANRDGGGAGEHPEGDGERTQAQKKEQGGFFPGA
jgi:hypothetical protein